MVQDQPREIVHHFFVCLGCIHVLAVERPIQERLEVVALMGKVMLS